MDTELQLVQQGVMAKTLAIIPADRHPALVYLASLGLGGEQAVGGIQPGDGGPHAQPGQGWLAGDQLGRSRLPARRGSRGATGSHGQGAVNGEPDPGRGQGGGAPVLAAWLRAGGDLPAHQGGARGGRERRAATWQGAEPWRVGCPLPGVCRGQVARGREGCGGHRAAVPLQASGAPNSACWTWPTSRMAPCGCEARGTGCAWRRWTMARWMRCGTG